jgi:DNA repair exonuclease SbcCD ATPase subunit
MKKLIVLAGTLCVTLTVCGCGSDLREALINGATESMNKASGTLSAIKENVDKWDKETREAEKTNVLKKAVESTKSLHTAAQGLQRVRQEAMQLEPAAKELREQNREKYQKGIVAAVERLNKEQKGLNDALIQAEKNHPDQKTKLTELKQKLQLAQAEFELQAKQQ